MCRNHSHVATTTALMLQGTDGISVILGQLQSDLTVEDGFSGTRLIAPPGATLLIVSQNTGEASSLQSRVMAVLGGLLSMDLATLPNNGGDTNLRTPKKPSASS
jgi:hypothetical protein